VFLILQFCGKDSLFSCFHQNFYVLFVVLESFFIVFLLFCLFFYSNTCFLLDFLISLFLVCFISLFLYFFISLFPYCFISLFPYFFISLFKINKPRKQLYLLCLKQEIKKTTLFAVLKPRNQENNFICCVETKKSRKQ